MVIVVRFLNDKDYSDCSSLVVDRKDFIEKYYKEDYRYWISPLAGYLHNPPFERFQGTFQNYTIDGKHDKKMAGAFVDGHLESMAGLRCHNRSRVALIQDWITKTHMIGDRKEVFVALWGHLCDWAEYKGKDSIFSFHHPKVASLILKSTEDFHWVPTIIAEYKANEKPSDIWHHEILEFDMYPFLTQILRWNKRIN